MPMALLTRWNRMALPVIGLAVACAAVGIMALINLGQHEQIAIDTGQTREDRFGLQGTHHRVGMQLINAAGRVFIIDDIVVAKDRIAIRYHAIGVSPIPHQDAMTLNPLYKTEPLTMIKVTADGVVLLPYEATIGSDRDPAKLRGEHVSVFSGTAPHHLQISVVRIEGDLDAVFATEADI